MKGAKSGQNWRSQILFDPSSDELTNTVYCIDDDSLIDSMSDLIDDRETIQQIWVCKSPLSSPSSKSSLSPLSSLSFSLPLLKRMLNHQFVVMETRKWWWSIEKNGYHILMQRSKRPSSVQDFRTEQNSKTCELEGGIRRETPIVLLSYDEGRTSMKEFVEFLYKKDELNKPFDWIEDNCQDFAKRIFDEFAKTKYHDKLTGSG